MRAEGNESSELKANFFPRGRLREKYEAASNSTQVAAAADDLREMFFRRVLLTTQVLHERQENFTRSGLMIDHPAHHVWSTEDDRLSTVGMTQGGFGTCYLLGVMSGMSTHPTGFLHLQRAIDPTPSNSQWTVSFGDYSTVIKVSDLIEMKSVRGREGVQANSCALEILERAYLRYQKEQVDAHIPTIREEEMEGEGDGKGGGGKGKREVFQDFVRPSYLESARYAKPSMGVLNSHNSRRILTAWTRSSPHRKLEFVSEARGKKVEVINHHAYTLEHIDRSRQTLVIVNPHDTERLRWRLTFEEFCKRFHHLYVGTLREL